MRGGSRARLAYTFLPSCTTKPRHRFAKPERRGGGEEGCGPRIKGLRFAPGRQGLGPSPGLESGRPPRVSRALRALASSPPPLLTSIRFKNVRKGWKSLDIRKMHRSNKHTIPFCWSRSPYDGCGKSILAGGGEGQANQNQPVRATELTKGEEKPRALTLTQGPGRRHAQSRPLKRR